MAARKKQADSQGQIVVVAWVRLMSGDGVVVSDRKRAGVLGYS
jgi:hypothetical protein